MTTLSQDAITSVDDFSPISVGDTAKPLAPQFWTWSNTSEQYVPLNLSGYTLSMKMQNSVGIVKTCAGSWVTDSASQGQAHYAWQASDVDTAGVWSLYITLTNGSSQPVHADVKTLVILSAV